MHSGTGPPRPGPLPEGQSRDRLLAEVARALQGLPEHASALVAVSGGPDSTALAFLTAEARPDLTLTLGHVRHGLRDDRADLRTVQDHASFLGVGLQVTEVVVTPTGEGIEAAARAHRYAALRRQVREAGAAFILLGHTAEDQAETLLMRLARGTGVPGLAGMPASRGGLVRPLLRLRRNDVRRYVVQEGLPSVDDPMNRDPSLTRTIARHRVLPALAALGPDPVAALARLAEIAREDAEKLDLDAQDAQRELVRRYGPVALLRRDALLERHPAIAKRVVRDVVADVRGTDEPPSAAQVARVFDLSAGAAVDLPGLSVTAGGGWIAIGPQDLTAPEDVPLTVPGRSRWEAAGLEILAIDETSGRHHGEQLALELGGHWVPPEVEVASGLVPPGGRRRLGAVVLGGLGARGRERLVVRSRRPGDRIRRSAGSRKVQDVLVDAGVPRLVRDLVPIVALGEQVLWVPGIAVDAAAVAAGVTDPELLLVLAVPGRTPLGIRG